jgi:NTE family protein
MLRCAIPLIALLATALAVGAARAQQASAEQVARPKICLVLSGGGARGAAHVGVVKILEQMRVPIDCVVGTSMGAIVGAAYASGSTLPEMEGLLGTLSTRILFKELPPREERSIHQKIDDARNLSPELGLGREGLLLPKGLVSGVQLESVLRRLSKARGFHRFDDLPIPFRAVATDLATGKPVVLSQGELASAMRASMSVPGVVDPVRLEGRLLVDGGLTNNLPVDVARAMGADVVIAVNLGTPLLRADELNSILGVTAQMINILTEQNVQASLASLRPTDILILPQLGNFSATDFDHLTATVPIGEAAARTVTDQLARYSVSPDAYARWDERRLAGTTTTASVTVDEIRLDNLKRVNPETARSMLQTRPDEPIDTQVLDRDMQRLFGTGDFEHVSYSLLEEPDRRILSIDAVEKSWGPNYLRLGLELSSDFGGDAFFNLLASYRMTWLNRLGGEWRTDLQFGRINQLATQFYQPLRPDQRLFVAPYALYERRTTDVFQGEQRIASYDNNGTSLGIALGAHFTRYGEVRLGVERSSVRSTLDTGLPVFETDRADLSTTSITLRAVVDQLDSLNFPRSGYRAKLAVMQARQSLGSDVNFTRAETSGNVAHSLGEHTFQFGWNLGQRFGSDPLPPFHLFQWGGFLQQSGFPSGALLGEELRFARLVYYNRLAQWQLLDGVYAGGSLEIGRMGKPLIPNNDTGTLHSASLLLGVDTPLGPLYLGYGRTSNGFKSLYLFLGRP